MRAVVYSQTGGPEVLRLVERPVREPGPGEVRVKMQVSGVNPTDWKARRGGRPGAELPFPELVPNQDGAGTIDTAGDGVPTGRVGERVWLWEAAWQRADGTAQELVVIPSRQAVRLPDAASMDVGASLGIPALTAHRCLTVSELGPRKLAPGALRGQTVLVAGGAGAVGHAAIQLARWAGARVISTVSSEEKARLALAAGAEKVVNYRTGEAPDEIQALATKGIDVIVEVAPAQNAALDVAVLAPNGTVAAYATDEGQRGRVERARTDVPQPPLPVRPRLHGSERGEGSGCRGRRRRGRRRRARSRRARRASTPPLSARADGGRARCGRARRRRQSSGRHQLSSRYERARRASLRSGIEGVDDLGFKSPRRLHDARDCHSLPVRRGSRYGTPARV